MAPKQPLPIDDSFANAEEYVQSLLQLVTQHELFRTLCGGVHILDFFTSEPPLYDQIIPAEWRSFFTSHSMPDLLELYLREDLDTVRAGHSWRDGPCPPESLVQYIKLVQRHLLNRELDTSQCSRNRTEKQLSRHVSVGMNLKKTHEVGLFVSYIHSLASEVSQSLPEGRSISHLVDFGSGQGYLGRALASEPYNRRVVAIESKSRNAERARDLDIKAQLLTKLALRRNKKAFRAGLVPPDSPNITPDLLLTPPPETTNPVKRDGEGQDQAMDFERPPGGQGTVQYVSHYIRSGDLTDVISNIHAPEASKVMVISLHSCGNLIHHGLRSLTANPSVAAVAMTGCCYNLITERLGPATFKLPELRPTTHAHPRLEKKGEACDPDGFPMSRRFCEHGGTGVRLNITARAMAVQAPKNWGERSRTEFFKRHFYRALLQRIFLDRGVVGPPDPASVGGELLGHRTGGTPIIIGALAKSCYVSFVAYVRGALVKLYDDEKWTTIMHENMDGITDDEISNYEKDYSERHKDLNVIWSLMAFSAGVVEAAIVVDRWLWLTEQDEVKTAWVESVFDYKLSPRNLVVVGIKR